MQQREFLFVQHLNSLNENVINYLVHIFLKLPIFEWKLLKLLEINGNIIGNITHAHPIELMITFTRYSYCIINNNDCFITFSTFYHYYWKLTDTHFNGFNTFLDVTQVVACSTKPAEYKLNFEKKKLFMDAKILNQTASSNKLYQLVYRHAQ